MYEVDLMTKFQVNNSELFGPLFSIEVLIFRLPVLQERLAKLTDIHAGDQLIMWMDKELCDVIDTSKCVSDYLRSVRKAQLFLVSRSCLDSYGLKPINTRMYYLNFMRLIFFILKILSAFYVHCIYSSALQTRLYHGS